MCAGHELSDICKVHARLLRRRGESPLPIIAPSLPVLVRSAEHASGLAPADSPPDSVPR